MNNNTVEESYEEHNNTSKEIGKALISNNFDNSLDYAEMAIDAFVTEGVLKEIPIVKTVVGVVNSGLKIREIFFSKKILSFIKEFHLSKLSQNKIDEFKMKFTENKKFRNKVIEHIMVFNDSFLEVEKSKIFANLFACYLNNMYDWKYFVNLTVCLDQMNMYGVSLFEDMEKFKKPFHGSTHDDKKGLYPLLLSSGVISIYGDHLYITTYGLIIYFYGIQGRIDEDLREVYPSLYNE